MPVRDYNAPYTAPPVQIWTKDKFEAADNSGVKNKSSGDWTLLPISNAVQAGYELLQIHRTALPEIGSASFRFVHGKFVNIGDHVDPPNLLKKEVRIKMIPVEGEGWKTVFWGYVDYQEDTVYPGGESQNGIRIYRCVDGFARTTKWPADRTGYATGGNGDGGAPVSIGPGRVNPGYNYQLQSDGPILGNKSPDKVFTRDGVDVKCHIWQGAFALIGTNPAMQLQNKWYETEMVHHACAATKPDGEPQFTLVGPAKDNFNVVTPQSVNENESVWDVVSRILGRRRGNGVVWVDWEDAGADLIVYLRVGSLISEAVTYVIPGQAPDTASITGATSGGTKFLFNGEYVWDIEGDHRNLDSVFRMTDGETNVHDYVEVFGERIQSVATLCMYDGVLDNTDGSTSASIYTSYAYSLNPRWSNSDLTTFTGLETQKRNMPYWDFIFQGFGLPRDWAGCAGNGFNTNKQRVDYRCSDAGEILVPEITDPADTLGCNVEIMGSLPLYEGYKYVGVSYPQRTDNSQQLGLPQRRAPTVYLRPAGWSDKELDLPNNQDRWFLPAGQLPAVVYDEKIYPQGLQEFQPTLTVHPDGIQCYSQAAMDLGLRYIADPAQDAARPDAKSIGAYIPVTRLAFTVCLNLPHRLRMAKKADTVTDWSDARRRKSVYVQNCHLWLCSPNAIIDLKQTDPTKYGWEPQRGCLGATTAPAILRDDRPLLARYYELAWRWYLYPRRRITVGMSFCGLLDFNYYVTDPDTPLVGRYPKLGDFIDTLRANGKEYPVGTVITSVLYDHQQLTTTWETDWFDLEFR
jgi:hypothetical protein